MLQAILRCISSCCGTIGHWCSKIYRRARLLYYLQYIDEYKVIKVNKAKKRHFQKQDSVDWQCLTVLFFPLLYMLELLTNLWVNVTTSFVADKYSNYLSLMLKKGTREYQLCSSTLMFILGLLTTIFFYYMQTFILQRFDMNTLYFALFILFVCALAPLLTRYGQAISLLVVPVTLTSTVRAILIGILLMDVHRIGLANIDDNFDKAMKTISCDRQAVGSLMSKMDFNFKVGDMRSKKRATSFDVTLADKDDFLYSVIATIRDINDYSKIAYRHAMYALNGLVQVSKSVVRFISDAFRRMINNPITRFIRSLSVDFATAIDSIGKVIKLIGDKIEKGFVKLEEMVKEEGRMTKNKILNKVTVKYHANYVFNATTARNTSINKIFGNAKRHLLERFSWVLVLRAASEWVLYLWIVRAFYQIFFVAFVYLVLFLNVGPHDNLFLTQAFFEYDRDKQMNGYESLLPLYLYEHRIFVPRRGVQLNALESASMFFQFIVDCFFALYTLYIFAMDMLSILLVEYVRDISLRVASDFIMPSINFTPKAPLIARMFKKGGKLMSDLKALREDIKKCSPVASPIAWEVYQKASVCLSLLFLLTIASPYINRTRSYICEVFFPERKSCRAAWLYGHIQLQRVITRTVVKLFNPLLANQIFIKTGQVNPLLNDILAPPPQPKVFFLLKIWPFSCFAKMLGLVKGPPTCAKCPKKIDIKCTKASFKCPNSFCDAYYCVPCFAATKKNCIVCRVEIRDEEEDVSEEADSSGDEEL